MFKSKSRKVAALAGTLAALVVVVALTIASTGAYFTDAHTGGQISGNLGTVAINVNGHTTDHGVGTFTFADMLPGQAQSADLAVTNTGTAAEDIYIVFDNAGGGWSALNTLGQFGDFAINGTHYDNLNNTSPEGTPSIGGSISTNSASGCYLVPRMNAWLDHPSSGAIAYLPHFVQLGALPSTAGAHYTLSFEYNPCLTGGQGAPIPTLSFAVVAFQNGVNPKSQLNGNPPMIQDLILPSGFLQ